MSQTKHDLDTVLEAVRGTGKWARDGKMTTSGGNVSQIARRLNVTRQTVYGYKKRWATVDQAIAEERDAMLDFAESQLWKQVADGNITAIIFTLKTQGRERGWIERYEHAGVKDEPIKFIVEYADGVQD